MLTDNGAKRINIIVYLDIIYFCKIRKLKNKFLWQYNMYNESFKLQCVIHHTEALLMPFLLIWTNLAKGMILVGLSVTKSKVLVNIFLNWNRKMLFSLGCSLKNFIYLVNFWYCLYT